MTSEPPPSRYRVVERGRRLEVIDTRSERPVRSPPPSSRPAQFADRGDPILRSIALLLCGGRCDDEGRPVLTTADWFDAKAPRRFALDREDVDRLVWSVVAVAGLVAALTVGAGVLVDGGAIGMLIVLAAGSRQGKRFVTRWLDGFEGTPPAL